MDPLSDPANRSTFYSIVAVVVILIAYYMYSNTWTHTVVEKNGRTTKTWHTPIHSVTKITQAPSTRMNQDGIIIS